MKRFLSCFFSVIAIVYIPSLFVLAFFPRSTEGGASYALNLLFFFLYSFPFYCVFLEVGATCRQIGEHKTGTTAEKGLHAIRLILSVGIGITLANLSEYLYWALAMAVAWVFFRVLGVVLFRQNRKPDELFQTKKVWISVIVTFLVVCVALLIFRLSLDSKNRLDPEINAISHIKTGCEKLQVLHSPF